MDELHHRNRSLLPLCPLLKPNEIVLATLERITFECIPVGMGPRRPRGDYVAVGKPGSRTPEQIHDLSEVDTVGSQQSLNDRVR
jgi:hypothetical protein